MLISAKASRYEAVFDVFYLAAAFAMGLAMLVLGGAGPPRLAAGAALVLAGGDAFHLVPRVRAILSQNSRAFRRQLALGKLVTSLTITVFYVLLWELGLALYQPAMPWPHSHIFYLLALLRGVLCLLPQNRWSGPSGALQIWRNVPFVLQGLFVGALFYANRAVLPALFWMWAAIGLSFVFYLPVVLFSAKWPAFGMLMLPKTCMYLWMLLMLLTQIILANG